MHAYIGSLPPKPGRRFKQPLRQTVGLNCVHLPLFAAVDNSALRVKDGKQIEVVDGSTGEVVAQFLRLLCVKAMALAFNSCARQQTLNLQVDHVFQQATESDVMERSLRSLTAACVEGVNVSVLAVGSAKTPKCRVLFTPLTEQSIAAAVFNTLLDALQAKVAALSSSGVNLLNGGGDSVGVTPARRSQTVTSATFSLRVSFAEFYEETITDLLAGGILDDGDAANGSSRPPLAIEDDPGLGKTIRNLTQSSPLTSATSFRRLLDAGINARRSANGLYGNACEFSSAVLRSGASVRLSEGPLLNKSLFAFQEVVQTLGGSDADGTSASSAPVRYQASQLTTLLQDALGGNCLTFVLLCLSPGDLTGSTATLQLGRLLPRVHTFPVVNNDMFRGLRQRQRLAQQRVPCVADAPRIEPEGQQGLAVYERRLHDLEGKLAQSGLERRVLRDDKDALVAQLGELRGKYRELFDNELALRSELLACEQEKLALSKAFVAFQLERDVQAQQLDSDKFEAETRLLKAEQLVVEIQQDDATKAAQIQDLCAKMNELVADKTRLGTELAFLQQAAKSAEQTRDAEAKKNQQLSLELIVAVNQKQKLQGEMETRASQSRSLQTQSDAQKLQCSQLRSDNEALRQQVETFGANLEAMRKDVVRRELELERAELAARKEQLETQQAGRDAEHLRERTTERLSEELTAKQAAFAAEKHALELQLERLQRDLVSETREKQHAMTSWKAKSEENEELLLALERARHDSQAQLETFRLKLALLHQSTDAEEGGNRAGAGPRALRELLSSYQLREKELRDQLESMRNVSLRLARRLRNLVQVAVESPQTNEDDRAEKHEKADEEVEVGELELLRDRLAAAEQRVALEMEQRTEQALLVSELETQNAQLMREQKKRPQQNASPRSHSDDGVRAIAEMHAALTRQLDEVRRLTLQQQDPQQTRSIDSGAPAPLLEGDAGTSTELQALRAANAQLETRLSSTKTHWTALLEQVERRCAELLTKNVMLTEDNQSLRQHITKLHKQKPPRT
ncbi:hypothetical protein BBJ28_00021500 [Nothophytophthora sp. Chile5]|nr:hypothetical protein BBJ28_00021500 [Nothophytophthora sp. Chile5]